MKHRANYITMIEHQVADIQNERAIPEGQAFTHLAAQWLGYDLDDDHFTDSKSDRGVDFWFGADNGFEFYQVKSHELSSGGQLETRRFDRAGVDDLRRISELLGEEEPPPEANRKIQNLVREWNMALSKKRLAEDPEPIEATLVLVLFGDGLTDQAQAEYDIFSKVPERKVGGVPIIIRARLLSVNDLIAARWRQLNRGWEDRTGAIRKTVDLYPEVLSGGPAWIPGHNSAVFYCRAVDLIQAFDELGYQIFEPNVRAHIRRSKVNAQIRSSLSHHQTRKEFRFLNNGVTITCKGFSKPSQNRPSFRVTMPGVVNGLQTVVALHQEYGELPQDDKGDLERSCFVLVRLLTEAAVSDVNKVVLATNNQNPMQPRNLRSNTEEQIHYERLFADMGWFFERKQGAWDAFKEDPARWRTLHNYRKASFLGEAFGQGRRKERRVDNEELAQTWLSLLGFSDEAVHRKRDLFDNEQLYDLAFLRRPRAHASSYDYDLQRASEESESQAPSPQLLLVSYLAREMARGVPLTAREARQEAISRMGLDPSQPNEVLDAKLSQDVTFLRSRVLNGMSFVFCDFLGHVLFRTFGRQTHYVGPALLKTPSLIQSMKSGTMDVIVEEIRAGSVKAGEVLGIVWFTFDHIIDELLAGAWRDSYLASPVKSKFLYSKDTRNRLARSFNDLEGFMQRSQLTKPWAAHIGSGVGIGEYCKLALEAAGA